MTRVRELLNQARVMSEAPAGQLDRVGGRQHPGSRPPSSYGASLLDDVARRLRNVRSDEDLRGVIEWLELEIRMLTHGPDRQPETREQFRFRVCSEYEGRPAREASDRERVSIALVRQIREADGRDPRTGRKLPAK